MTQEMLDITLEILLNLLATLALLGGLFFMIVGAVGILRLPDFYSRSHAAGKCITLGISGLLMALVLYIGVGGHTAVNEAQAALNVGEPGLESEAPVTAAVTKALLVIAFIIISAPVGSHMLARAAHLAGVKAWSGTLSDELAETSTAPEEASQD